MLGDYNDWLKGDRKTPAPDLVECLALYGYVRFGLEDWRLPIDIPKDEWPRWREAGFHLTLEDFQDRIASVAGGFLEFGGSEPQLTIQIIQQQLDKKLADMKEYASLPLDEYTPRHTEEALRARFVAEGLTPEEVEEELAEELLDSGEIDESRRFNRPFAIREELECFEWAVERMRLLSIGERTPELGLPNRELYFELMRLDLNGLLGHLEAVDFKLKRIIEHLMKFDYTLLNDDRSLKRFWWRHQKPKSHPRGQRHKRRPRR
jgi:hypothetical protein